MTALVYFDSFTTEVTQGTHTAALDANTDVLKVYLTNTTPSVSTHTVKGDLTEIAAGNGYTAGGEDATNSFASAGGVTTVSSTSGSVSWTAAAGAIATFRYAVLYNDTIAAPLDPLIGYWDNGSAVDLADTKSFTLTFSSSEIFKVGDSV